MARSRPTRRRVSASPVPAVRLRTPAEVVAAVPLLLGFVPRESLVALGLGGGSGDRLVLTARVDLAGDAAGPTLADALLRAGARRVLLVVHTEGDDATGLPSAGLVGRVSDCLAERGLPVLEALLVRAGRWSSYTCAGPCCPRTGTPLGRGGEAVQVLAAEQVAAGRAVLAGRDQLVASLAPAPTLPPALVLRLQEQAATALAETRCPSDELVRWRRALERERRAPAAAGAGPDPGEAAALVVALADVAVRDAVAAEAARRPEPATGLLLHLARQAVPPHDAPLCAVLGAVLLAAGNGAAARVALDRALAVDPALGLARLLLQCLDGAVPPAQVRCVLRAGAAGGPRW